MFYFAYLLGCFWLFFINILTPVCVHSVQYGVIYRLCMFLPETSKLFQYFSIFPLRHETLNSPCMYLLLYALLSLLSFHILGYFLTFIVKIRGIQLPNILVKRKIKANESKHPLSEKLLRFTSANSDSNHASPCCFTSLLFLYTASSVRNLVAPES